jgi:hypothetical protein
MDYIRINGAPQYTNEHLLDGASPILMSNAATWID